MRSKLLLIIMLGTVFNAFGSINNYHSEKNDNDLGIIPELCYQINNGVIEEVDLTQPFCPILIIPSKLYIQDYINDQKVIGISKNVFKSKGLEKVIIPDSVTYIGEGAFEDNRIFDVHLPSSLLIIDKNAFDRNRLSSVAIPNSTKTIDNEAFANNILASVSLPNSLESIGDYAFYLNQLSIVTIPEKVINIGFQAFCNQINGSLHKNLLKIIIKGSRERFTSNPPYNSIYTDKIRTEYPEISYI